MRLGGTLEPILLASEPEVEESVEWELHVAAKHTSRCDMYHKKFM